tara:strand:- start:1689 stop:1865 length:177 start_codon:yes stop_codon:yes gene_type:complete
MAYPTNPIYKFYKGSDGTVCGIKTTDGTTEKQIPLSEANTDYQEYLEWAKTNTAEAAD